MNFDSLALNLIVVHLEEVFAMADAVSVFGKVDKIFIFTTVLRKLRMRKQHTIEQDVVPERRTKRCFPRFRPSDCFCELSF